ncbi:MAG TPA: DUF3617 family protein [Candidatus Competibacteraceae bacterium]|nr:DUF3617 family protein [Candidatus Competibacteraceae bacterium]
MGYRRAPAVLLLVAMTTPVMVLGLEAGQWEFSVKLETLGVPQGSDMPSFDFSQVYTECVSAQDIDQLKPPTIAQDGFMDCRVLNSQQLGKTVEWDLACRTHYGEAKASARVTASGDTQTGEMLMAVEGDGDKSAFKLKQTWAGRRLGSCR